MLNNFINWVVDTVGMLGYPGIVIMMMLESSFFPFPSEVVMIPAGYLASKGEMNIFIVVFLGVIGSIIGALINYYIALYLGKPFLLKYGKYVRITPKTVDKLEHFFNKHGAISTFIGRLLPGIRQYISFPAGLSKMKLPIFISYTSLGAGLWVVVLVLIGYFVGENEALIKQYSHYALFSVVALSILTIGIYIFIKKRGDVKKS